MSSAVALPLIEALEAVLDVFKGPAATQAQAGEGKEQQASVKALADRLRGDAGKVGVMLGDGSSPITHGELQGLLSAVQQSAASLAVCLHSLTYQAGPTLKQDLRSGATSMVNAAVALIKATAEHASPNPSTAVTHAIGAVWDACDSIKKQPLDNKAALFKRLAGTIRGAKDAVREMEELAHENQAADTLAEGDEGQDDDEEEEEELDRAEAAEASEQQPADQAASAQPSSTTASNGVHQATGSHPRRDPEAAPATGQEGEAAEEEEEKGGLEGEVDYDSDPLSAQERQVLSAGQELLKVAVQAVQLLAKHLLTATSLGAEVLEGWESSVWHAKTLERAVEDLGTSLYAPQDAEEVSGAAEAIAISLECMLDEVPQAAGEGGGGRAPGLPEGQVQALQQHLELVRSRLEALLNPGALALATSGDDAE